MKEIKSYRKTITPKEASELFGLNCGTLANLRKQKKGCIYYKRGKSIFYFIDDVERWLRSNPVQTADSIRE